MACPAPSHTSAEPPRALRARALAGLHAGVWHADELACAGGGVVASGHAALDAALPGGGWPLGALIELLQAAPDAPAGTLLWPAVAARLQTQGGVAVLVNPPHEPFLPALAAAGVAARQVLWLRADTPAAQLWATEQALRCADAAAVLAWLPRARSAELRRLHLAAAQRLDSLLFALRPDGVAASASPALLRLRLRASPGEEGAAPALAVDILKRRGPPQGVPLHLPAHSERLRALLAASARLQDAMAPQAGDKVLPFGARWGDGADHDHDDREDHALDRIAVAA